jgi:hypothetical protein
MAGAAKTPLLRRRLFNLVTALSLVLCVAAAVQWARSYRKADLFILTSDQGRQQRLFSSSFGAYRWGNTWNVNGFRRADSRVMESRELPRHWTWERETAANRRWSFLGVSYFAGDLARAGFSGEAPIPFRTVVVPHAWVLLLSIALPALFAGRAAQRRRRQKRAARGLCAACGYDLRATPGRCPECSAVPQATNAA